MGRMDAPLRGLGIPDPRISFDTLLAQGGGVLNSSFSQAGAGPGSARAQDALAKLRPIVSNAQTEDMQVEVIKSGVPIREGCAVRYKLSDEADSEMRGWNPPVYLHGWRAAEFGTVETFDLFDTATIPSSQKVVLVYKRLSDGVALSRVWDPTAHTWSAAVTILAVGTGPHAAVAVLPDSERILAMVGQNGGIYSSDDGGATWSPYALQALGANLTEPATLKRDRMVVTPDGTLALFHQLLAPVDGVVQYASGDLGASWTLVESTVLGDSVDACVFSDGTIGVIAGTTWRRLASPFDAASEALAVTIDSGAEFACWVDDDDVVYTAIRNAIAGSIQITQSNDFGGNWDPFVFSAFFTGDLSTFPINLSVSATKGGAWCCTNWSTTPGTHDGSIGGMELGGWSNGVLGTLSATAPQVINRGGFGGDIAGAPGATWVPFELPGNVAGWTQTGAAGTLVAPGELELITVAASSFVIQNTGTESFKTVAMELRVDAFGNQATNDVAALIRSSDGVNSSVAAIRFSTTGYTLHDIDGAVDIGAVAIDMTTNLLLKVQINSRVIVAVYHKRPKDTNWTLGVSGTLTLTGGFATGRLKWGHTTSTATSHWVQFHFVEDLVFAADAAFGKAVGALPYPIPDVSSQDCAFLRLDAGPGTRGERYDIATVYEFGVERMFPSIDPSPDVRHRTIDDLTETIYAFDLGADSLLARTFFAFLAGTSYRTAEIESSTAASAGAVWTARGTWDAAEGFTGLTYLRSGDSVRPNVGSPTAVRALGHGEAVGGWVLLAAAVARRIGQHLSGWWGGTVEPELRLEGITGAEPASGTLQINHSAAVLVIQTGGTIRDRYWRIRIPVQATPEGYFETGIALIGYCQPAGKQHGWDYSVTIATNRDEQTSAYGTSRIRELGPPRRRWSGNWTEGNDMLDLRGNSDPDFQAHSGGSAPPLVARNDVYQLLWGLLEELDSGERVCLALPAIPDTTSMITDRTLYTYGRIGDRVRVDGVVGDEGISEVVRVQALPVGEVR